MSQTLTIALPKGRIYQEALPLLATAGIKPSLDPATSRQLIIPTHRPDIRLVIVRTSDVPTYVQYGGADLGIAGKDILMEHGGDGLYEPLDLNIARCRLMLARRADALEPHGRLRIATKYVNTTRRYFAVQGRQVDIIKLYGSMELAPLVGLADYIVDVVDTGNTLKANGLEPVEPAIAHISSRLIVNRAAMKRQHSRIHALQERLADAIAQKSEVTRRKEQSPWLTSPA